MTSRKSRGGDWDGWTRGSFVIFGWELSGCATKTYENIWGSLRKSVKWWIWDHLERTWLKFVMNVWPGSQGGKTGETHGCQWLLQTSQAWQSERSYGFVENPTPKHLNWFKCNILSPCPQYRKGKSTPLSSGIEIVRNICIYQVDAPLLWYMITREIQRVRLHLISQAHRRLPLMQDLEKKATFQHSCRQSK